MQAGRDSLALYTHAMTVTEKASHKPIHARGVALEAQGEGIWTAAKDAQPRPRMWTWLMWDLPGRCEVAAKRLEHHQGITTQAGDAPTAEAAAVLPVVDGPAAGADAPKAAPQSIDDALPAATPAPTDTAAPPALRGPQ
jgi:hypothetical protein